MNFEPVSNTVKSFIFSCFLSTVECRRNQGKISSKGLLKSYFNLQIRGWGRGGAGGEFKMLGYRGRVGGWSLGEEGDGWWMEGG